MSARLARTTGALCLDLATFPGSRRSATRNPLRAYDDLVDWAQALEVLGPAEARRLRREGERRPMAARAVLARAIAFGETIRRIFAAVAAGDSPSLSDLEALNAEIARAMAHARVARRPGGYAWGWESDPDALDAMLWPAARSAAELLVALDSRHVRQCASATCSGLFVDTTRNHSRRWCDMRTCGNRAKVSEHRRRRRGA